MKRIIEAIFPAFLAANLLAASVMAGGLWPDVPKATGKAHPEGNEWMRINHPDMLRHDRDLTMHKGKRDVAFSLAACVDCHAVSAEDGQPVGIEDDRHFCRACHDFAAVRIDCFECHNSKPQPKAETAMLNPPLAEPKDILAWLREVVQ